MSKITMYTLSTCPWCRKTKKYFQDRNVEFSFIDYDLAGEEDQNRISAEMMKNSGHIAFPFVKFGDIVVVGFNPERFEQLIRSGSIQPVAH